MLNFCDFIPVYVFTSNYHLKELSKIAADNTYFIFFTFIFKENKAQFLM